VTVSGTSASIRDDTATLTLVRPTNQPELSAT